MAQSGRSHLGRALFWLTEHRVSVFTVLLFSLFCAGASAVEPLILKYIFDHLGPGGLHYVFIGIGVVLGIGIIREILNAISNWLVWRSRLAIHHSLLERTVGRLQSMSF